MSSIVFLACHTRTYKPHLYSIPMDEIQKFLFMAKKKKWILLSILSLVTPTWAFRPIEYEQQHKQSQTFFFLFFSFYMSKDEVA